MVKNIKTHRIKTKLNNFISSLEPLYADSVNGDYDYGIVVHDNEYMICSIYTISRRIYINYKYINKYVLCLCDVDYPLYEEIINNIIKDYFKQYNLGIFKFMIW